jgi:sugar phosphate isomerase/epimerase
MLIGAATLGYLYTATLAESLRSIRAAGYDTIELGATPPHFNAAGASDLERLELKRLLRREGVACATINPIDINLISPYAELAEFAHRQVVGAIELAHEVEAACVVFSPGQRHRLIPSPKYDAYAALARQLTRLIPVAERLQVRIAVETVPFGLLQTGREAVQAIASLDSSWLGVGYDPANTVAAEPTSPAQGIVDVGDKLEVVHVSGSWTHRWAHVSVRDGDVDYAEVAQALRTMEFSGPSIYELVDGDDPELRLRQDAELLRDWGWDTTSPKTT